MFNQDRGVIQTSVHGFTCLAPLEIHLTAFMLARVARTSVIGPSSTDLLAWIETNLDFTKV